MKFLINIISGESLDNSSSETDKEFTFIVCKDKKGKSVNNIACEKNVLCVQNVQVSRKLLFTNQTMPVKLCRGVP